MGYVTPKDNYVTLNEVCSVYTIQKVTDLDNNKGKEEKGIFCMMEYIYISSKASRKIKNLLSKLCEKQCEYDIFKC